MFDFFVNFVQRARLCLFFLVNFVCHNRPWMIFRARNSVSHGGVTRGFPLELVVENFVTKEVPFNPDLLKHMFPKIEWKALHDAAKKMDENDLQYFVREIH